MGEITVYRSQSGLIAATIPLNNRYTVPFFQLITNKTYYKFSYILIKLGRIYGNILPNNKFMGSIAAYLVLNKKLI